jgi:hypothetical protein
MSRQRFRCTEHGLVPIGEPHGLPARLAPDVMPDLPAYESPIDGRVIDGRAQRREDLRRHGCRPYESGETEDAQRRREAADRRLESHVNETVDRWWDQASGDKREALARALQMGLEAKTVRMSK